MKRKSKKRTIFYIFLIPLLGVIVLQSCITFGVFAVNKTMWTMQAYSVDTMGKTVENRKLILENDMNQRWSAIRRYENYLNTQMEGFLKDRNITIEEFLESDGLQEEVSDLFLKDCVDFSQSNLTTGIFFILTGYMTEGEYNGFYIRDSEPFSIAVNESDLLMERGNKALSRKYNMPLDIYWTTDFCMPDTGNPAYEFFYDPWRAGEEYPDNPVEDLGKWSPPFVLAGNDKDSYEMITYSLPLRYEGRVYAVLGVEISVDFLYDYLPVDELNDTQQAGYLLAIANEDGTYTPFLGKGVLYHDIVQAGETFQLEETKHSGLHEVSNVKSGNQSVYAVNCPLKLYSRQAPYDNTEWVLMGLNTEDALFGISRRLYATTLIAVCIGLGFGIVAINVLVRYFTNPLKRLAGSISRGTEGLEAYKPSNVMEIDSIYDVARDLFRRQKEVENTLLEEKELYRMVMESARELFFLYDFKQKTFEIINAGVQPEEIYEELLDRETGFVRLSDVYEDDREGVKLLWEGVEEAGTAEFRIKMESGEYQWHSVQGRIVRDIEGNRSKVIGSFQNIQMQKEIAASKEKRSVTDGVTGLYTYNAGMRLLREVRNETEESVLCYFCFQNLREINGENGPIFGDLILEAIGEIICIAVGIQGFAMRLSEGQIAVYIEQMQLAEGKKLLKRICDNICAAFPEPMFHLIFRAGIACDDKKIDNSTLICRAKIASYYFHEHIGTLPPAYEELSRDKQKKYASTRVQSRQIHTDSYLQETALVSQALSLFAKGDNLTAQIYLLFRKMGVLYGVENIYITIIRPDFNSLYLGYQWHKEPTEMENTVNAYKAEEFEQYIQWLADEPVHAYSEADSAKEEIAKFFHGAAGSEGIVVPLYDNGVYIGALSLEGLSYEILYDPEEKQNLQETVSVIQSQINQQRHDLASRAKSDFLSRMSHEIRTPMNGIIGMTTIAIKNQDDPERVSDCLYKIKGSSDYLLGLINDILDMSKIESGKMHLEPVEFDMEEILDNIIELINPQAKLKNIDFVENIALQHKGFYGDKLRLSQVLINLLGNAVKFTSEYGRVVLTVAEQEEGNKLFFAVQDSGRGIAKEDQEKIFQLFEQGSNPAGEVKQQGTGLGLSISRSLVRMMGSDIELESELGEGSTFSFKIFLPVVSLKARTDQKMEVSFEGRRILVVEDNELNSEIARNILEECGFQVDCVFNGQEAVERIQNTPPDTYDVVLMDIMMPVMDGLDATRAIRAMDREDSRTLPIIAMSANAFDDDLKKSVECGMNGHLSKPVELDKLYKKLAEVIEEKKDRELL